MRCYTFGQLGIAVGAVCAITALLAARHVGCRADHPGQRLPRDGYVYELAGDIRHGGFYCFPTAQNLGQLLAACGAAIGGEGAGPDVQQEVANGSRILCGPRVVIGPMHGRDRLNFFMPLDINTASVEDLDLIPGLGRKTAASIIAYRTAHQGVRALAELAAVRGLSTRKLQALKPYLTIER